MLDPLRNKLRMSMRRPGLYAVVLSPIGVRVAVRSARGSSAVNWFAGADGAVRFWNGSAVPLRDLHLHNVEVICHRPERGGWATHARRRCERSRIFERTPKCAGAAPAVSHAVGPGVMPEGHLAVLSMPLTKINGPAVLTDRPKRATLALRRRSSWSLSGRPAGRFLEGSGCAAGPMAPRQSPEKARLDSSVHCC